MSEPNVRQLISPDKSRMNGYQAQVRILGDELLAIELSGSDLYFVMRVALLQLGTELTKKLIGVFQST